MIKANLEINERRVNFIAWFDLLSEARDFVKLFPDEVGFTVSGGRVKRTYVTFVRASMPFTPAQKERSEVRAGLLLENLHRLQIRC